MVHYRVAHRTAYRYDDVVTSSYGQVHLLPRTDPGQICHSTTVSIDPAPNDQKEHTDFFGNRFVYFEITTAHRALTVTTDSSVEIDGRQRHLPVLADQPWEDVQPGRTGEGTDLLEFVLGSPLAAPTADLAAYAARSFPARRPVLEGLVELTERIHDDFAYGTGATTVATTADEALAARAGVCQDFAHVLIAGLRGLGLAARYVSGYLETVPPPGAARLVGADVSHAWASLLVPGVGWVDTDPTNRHLVDDRYITTAWGRDYGDVPPLKGVILTKGRKHDLEVSVDVTRVEGR